MKALYRVLIVDDEPLARQKLRELLADEHDFRVEQECADGDEALRALEHADFDLVLLDVEMPGRDGFALLAAIGPERMPPVVFVTAFDAYAVRAFEVHALDYLLKPLDRERFRAAMARVRLELERRPDGSLARRLQGLLSEPRAPERAEQRLVLRTGGRVLVLAPAEIEWIAAADNYLRFHGTLGEYLVRGTLQAMEEELRDRGFVRIQRSLLVRRDAIRELEPQKSGEYRVRLASGKVVLSGRNYRRVIASWLA